LSGIANLAVRLYGLAARIIPFDREPFASTYSALYFAYKRAFEDPFASLAGTRPELFRGGDVVDAGANIGYTALLFARFCDADANVHAFEPDPANVEKLTRNVARSAAGKRIRVRHAALGAEKGRVSLWHNAGHPGDHRVLTPGISSRSGKIVEVDLVSIDDEVFRPVCFVKVDVQGYEVEVSRGMQRTLAENETIVVALELMPLALREAGATPEELLEFYSSRGFHLHRLAGDGRVEVATPGDLLRDAEKNEYVNILCARRILSAGS
jgi:FkbM family methyltransferase